MLTRGKEAGEKVKTEFSHLTEEQLNWKPSYKQWSIAQCLDHLVVSDSLYFPAFIRIADGNYRMRFWEKWSPLGGFFGKMMVSQVLEKPRRKLKAPKVLAPSESFIDTGILDRFHKHLETLLYSIWSASETDIDKIHITSPVSKLVTYSLRHAFMLLIQHEHRHINQAMRVKGSKGFPG